MYMRFIEIEYTPAGCRVERYTAEQWAAVQAERKAASKRAAARRRLLDKIFCALALLSFLVVLGGAGGVDCGTLSLSEGVAYSVAGLAAMAVFTYLAHGFYGQYSEGD